MSASRSNRLSGVGLALAIEQTADQAADLGFGVLALHARQPLEVQPAEQLLVNAALELLILRVPGVRRAAGTS